MVNTQKRRINVMTDSRPIRTRTEKSFASGLNFYKLFWIFFVGCFLGVVIETLYCLVTRHHFESRQGLIYGPFNLVYGLGALAMTLGLYWLGTCGYSWADSSSAARSNTYVVSCRRFYSARSRGNTIICRSISMGGSM